jgi:hypothetical protein
MKKYCSTIFLLILLIASDNNAYSQKKPSDKLFDFVIVISQNDKKIVLESSKGCAWKELNFKTQKEQGIDNFGMSNDYNAKKDLKFYFTIIRTKTEFLLKGIKGTAWKELRFSIKNNKKYEVTKFGVKAI